MNRQKIEPRVIGMDAWEWFGPDELSPDCYHVDISSVEGVGVVGLYCMPPGKQTNTFSMDASDDGTADEY